MKHIESEIQRNCVTWFSLQYPELRMLLFAVPNGGARNKREAGIMKAEGVTAGVADMLFLYANTRFHGLCIEFKTPKGRQQDSQKQFQKAVERAGYKYIIVRSFDEFMHAINNHMYDKNTAD